MPHRVITPEPPSRSKAHLSTDVTVQPYWNYSHSAETELARFGLSWCGPTRQRVARNLTQCKIKVQRIVNQRLWCPLGWHPKLLYATSAGCLRILPVRPLTRVLFEGSVVWELYPLLLPLHMSSCFACLDSLLILMHPGYHILSSEQTSSGHHRLTLLSWHHFSQALMELRGLV